MTQTPLGAMAMWSMLAREPRDAPIVQDRRCPGALRERLLDELLAAGATRPASLVLRRVLQRERSTRRGAGGGHGRRPRAWPCAARCSRLALAPASPCARRRVGHAPTVRGARGATHHPSAYAPGEHRRAPGDRVARQPRARELLDRLPPTKCSRRSFSPLLHINHPLRHLLVAEITTRRGARSDDSADRPRGVSFAAEGGVSFHLAPTPRGYFHHPWGDR